ncbi:MAG: LysR substrate-binding domain-containing protein [Pseudomonadota bacterium]
MTTLRQLRYLEAVARHSHFGKAAEECSVSQPALSQQIKELEQKWGLALLERSPKHVSLTAEGGEAVRRARAILSAVSDLEDFARERTGTLSGVLRLGAIPSIAPYLLPVMLTQLATRYSDVDLRLRETVTESLVDELKAGKLDVIVAALPLKSPEIEVRELFVDRFLLAVRDDQNLQSGAVATPAMIGEDRLLLMGEGHCLREQVLSYCNIGASKLSRAMGASSLSTIVQMVANGHGVTLLPEMCIREQAPDSRIRLMRFADPQPSRTVAMAWRKSTPLRDDYMVLSQLMLDGWDG